MPYLPPPRTITFTAEAYAKLEAELKQLLITRKEVLERLKTAREMGDLSENGAYQYAKFEFGNTNRRLREVKRLLGEGMVWVKPSNTQVVDFGATVTLNSANRTLTFMLVSEHESDPTQDKLSIKSPIGQAVIGKKMGDQVTVTSPRGDLVYMITALQY